MLQPLAVSGIIYFKILSLNFVLEQNARCKTHLFCLVCLVFTVAHCHCSTNLTAHTEEDESSSHAAWESHAYVVNLKSWINEQSNVDKLLVLYLASK